MAGLTSVVLFAVLLAGCCHGYVDKTVYQWLVDNGYSSFVQLLKETRQDQVLSGPGPVTVFAPNNAAIARMDPDMMASLARNKLQETTLVKYHIVNDVSLLPDLGGKPTLQSSAGQNIGLTHLGNSLILNNASRVDSPPHNDIICNNGVVQPIDSVLIPPLYSTDNLFAVLLERDDLFKEFPLSLLLSNLSSLIEQGEYTIFAPTDYSYVRYLQNIIHRPNLTIDQEATIYHEMYKYHIVPGARPLATLTNHQNLYTLHGTPLNISVLTNGYMVNQASIVQGDIPASNGVIHAINDILFPLDLFAKLGIDPSVFNTGGNKP